MAAQEVEEGIPRGPVTSEQASLTGQPAEEGIPRGLTSEQASLTGQPAPAPKKSCWRTKRCIGLSVFCALLLIGLIIFLCLWFIPTSGPTRPISYLDTDAPDRLIVTNLFVIPVRSGNMIPANCGQFKIDLTLANVSTPSYEKNGCVVGFFLPSDVASQATLRTPDEGQNTSLWLHINGSTFPDVSAVLIPDVRDLQFLTPQNISALVGDPNSEVRYLVSATVFYDIGIPLPSTFASYPPHRGVSARWYIDGYDYMHDAYYAISNATSHVYITDWWLMPYVYLIRFPVRMEYRLDMLLARKASEGVQIRILLYGEIASSLPRSVSKETQAWMEALHPNIKVVRHGPSSVLDMRWSHHQKSLVVDNMIAFVGGIDLTYGRWDHSYHPLTDPNVMSNIFPGPDYQVPEAKVDNPVQPHFRDLADRLYDPREPWHDTQIGVEGWAAVDVAKNFVERWNSHITGRSGYAKLPPAGFYHNYTSGFLFSQMHNNITDDDDTNSTDSFEDIYSNYTYDLATLNYDPKAIPVWNELNLTGRKDVDDLPPFPVSSLSAPGALRCQVVRSIAHWSGLNKKIEQSIQTMMVNMINNAERFIYIENQFFISSFATATRTVSIHNVIAEAIVARIARAIRRKEKFRVIIITPVHPEGSVKAPENAGVLYLQLYTLFRGQRSIYGILNGTFPDVNIDDYVHFAALRNYGFLLNQTLLMNDLKAVTHQVYVHSKTMMVDDRHILIGSANINDRSLNGDRDSEIAIHCESEPDLRPDEAMLVPMDGKPFRVSRFVHAARMTAFNEHMGLYRNDTFMTDIVDDTVFQAWRERAAVNAAIYQEVFPAAVNNDHTTWALFDRAQKLPPKNVEKLKQIRGLLIDYPQQFLNNEPNFWPRSLSGCATQSILTAACAEIIS